MTFAAALLLALGLQENPADRWKIDFTATLVEKEKRWVFVVEGTTNVPAGTRLAARVYVVDTYDVPFQEPREDEEPLVRSDDEGQPAFRNFKPSNGRFREEVFAFDRKPFSVRYRARVHYLPEDQLPAVSLKVGDVEFSRKVDFRVGTDADYAAEVKERAEESGRHLFALEKLGVDLGERWADAQADPARWKEWRGGWKTRVGAIAEQNSRRYNLWFFVHESQSRMRIGALCELLEKGAVAREEGRAEAAERFRGAFHEYLEQAYDALGIEAPLDERKARPILAAYEEALEPLRAWIRVPVGDGSAILRKARREALVALFRLPPLVQNRKRGYVFVSTLGDRFTRLVERADDRASPEELREALRLHEQALSELKTYAGLH